MNNDKKYEKIILVVPPELSYSGNSVPGILANSTLVFEVELLDIKEEADHKSVNKAEKQLQKIEKKEN